MPAQREVALIILLLELSIKDQIVEQQKKNYVKNSTVIILKKFGIKIKHLPKLLC